MPRKEKAEQWRGLKDTQKENKERTLPRLLTIQSADSVVGFPIASPVARRAVHQFLDTGACPTVPLGFPFLLASLFGPLRVRAKGKFPVRADTSNGTSQGAWSCPLLLPSSLIRAYLGTC